MFCHIAPTNYLHLVANRPDHLVLAHLIEQDPVYTAFYKSESDKGANIIMDNSGFEMFKQGKPMMETSKLIDLAGKVGASYIALSDYPAEHAEKTINAAIDFAPQVKKAGFGTFFIPQSEVGNVVQLIESFLWAAESPLVDYIGYSILAIPNAYGVEKGNKLQRYNSRTAFVQLLKQTPYFTLARTKRHHFLGMVDGPREITMIKDVMPYNLDTWDSSAAIWAGLNTIEFDDSPTGLLKGKYEVEVDFNLEANFHTDIAEFNMEFIDDLWDLYGETWI